MGQGQGPRNLHHARRARPLSPKLPAHVHGVRPNSNPNLIINNSPLIVVVDFLFLYYLRAADCPEFGADCPEFGADCPEFGADCPESGARRSDAAVQVQAGKASKSQDPRPFSPATLLIGVPEPYTSNPQDFDHWGPRTSHLKVLGLHTPKS